MNKKLEKVKCFLLDMDGTVYLGDNLIDGAVDAVKRMNERCRALFLIQQQFRRAFRLRF